MPDIFLLSVLQPWAGMILSGRKRWEFRANPRFGRATAPGGERELAPGDWCFVVAVEPEGAEAAALTCCCRVGRILRGPEIEEYFLAPGHCRWLEAGFEDREEFAEAVPGAYATVVELDARPLAEPVAVERIRHAHTGEAWSGRGFAHAAQLRRYRLDGMPVEETLAELLPAG
jgi:hypothetical protein